MKIITPRESLEISFEIYEQVVQLRVRASDYQPPWGTAIRMRFIQLSAKRLKAVIDEHR